MVDQRGSQLDLPMVEEDQRRHLHWTSANSRTCERSDGGGLRSHPGRAKRRSSLVLPGLSRVDPDLFGICESSGECPFDFGISGRSGVGGGIVTVSAGKGGLAAFAAPLDPTGTSVRRQLVARFLAQGLGLDLFSSDPNGSQRTANSVTNHQNGDSSQ